MAGILAAAAVVLAPMLAALAAGIDRDGSPFRREFWQ